MDTERWLPIAGYEGYYCVSEHGRIKSLSRQVKTRGGAYRSSPETLLIQDMARNGYLSVRLSKFGVAKKKLVHRIVAHTFIANPHSYPMINHLDGIKSNNLVTNLEWCTHKINMRHAQAAGKLTCKNRRKWNMRLSDQDVKEIRALCASGKPNKAIASMFKVSACYISEIIHNKARSSPSFIPSGNRWTRKLSDSDIRQIVELRAQGTAQAELAKQFNVDQSRISRLTRDIWHTPPS